MATNEKPRTSSTRRSLLAAAAVAAGGAVLARCGGSGGAQQSATPAPAPAPIATPPPPSGGVSGLLFPGDDFVNRRFRRVLPTTSIPDPYPLTVVFQVYPQDKGIHYQTIFFHGVEGDFLAHNSQYYGCGPYPYKQMEMRWEIAAQSDDFVGDLMVYERWFNCACIAWSDSAGKHHRFYYDLPNAAKVIALDLPASYFTSLAETQSFTWGDAPWDHVTKSQSGGGKEQFKGIMRRMKIFTTNLSLADASAEALVDDVTTSAGASNLWYLNANPKPDDIQDKSGQGHDFSWFDPSATASLWTA